MARITYGSVCSGIEAASVAWKNLDFDCKWFSEIAAFPSKVLADKHPQIPNLGDMCDIPGRLDDEQIDCPDLICGGTPCQAFSLAGWKKGLDDHRGNLTLKFVDIIEANDCIRQKKGLDPSIVLWENVEGVLRDKTNAFGCFLASLAGLKSEFDYIRWPNAGVIHGPKRNIAWRVLDAKYFGLPQQRKRLYLMAGGKDFFPENILFDQFPRKLPNHEEELAFEKNGNSIELFRKYTDCLYSAYGTKWNGNAAAYNGSLFVVQNDRLRRFTPLECERLMGFPDNHTNLPGSRPTNRYQAVGNSWAVPVIRWIGERLLDYKSNKNDIIPIESFSALTLNTLEGENIRVYSANTSSTHSHQTTFEKLKPINGSEIPENPIIKSLFDVIDTDASENFYITPVGCKGILRRKEERKLTINSRLELILSKISAQWTEDRIEAVSRKQKRGQFSLNTITAPAKDGETERAA